MITFWSKHLGHTVSNYPMVQHIFKHAVVYLVFTKPACFSNLIKVTIISDSNSIEFQKYCYSDIALFTRWIYPYIS